MTEQKIFYYLKVSDWIFIQLNVPFNNIIRFRKKKEKKVVFSQGRNKRFFCHTIRYCHVWNNKVIYWLPEIWSL